jgi:hypothetical protein
MLQARQKIQKIMINIKITLKIFYIGFLCSLGRYFTKQILDVRYNSLFNLTQTIVAIHILGFLQLLSSSVGRVVSLIFRFKRK